MQQAPHKAVCVTIRALKDQLGQRSWSKLWADGMTPDEALKLLKAKGVDLDNVSEIGRLLNMITSLKIMSRGFGIS